VVTAIIAGGRRDHHSLLRTAGWCGAVTAALAAPLFWIEVSGGMAFVAFAVAGGMFAVSIPTNAVIGLRLSRDTRASAMGIAVGVLMGCQALGAALGGIAASVVGPPRAIGGALACAAAFSLWSVATTPTEAKHLASRRRIAEMDTVVDLVALEAEQPAAVVP
jgi:predicted MFS family arabinose efflux permease